MSTEVAAQRGTAAPARVMAGAAFLVAFALWVVVKGVPTDPFTLFGWIWLATVAWNVQAPIRSHLGFIRDWWPPLLVLVVYLYSRGLSDELGLFHVHITEPIVIDRWLGGGELPTDRLQSAMCGNPCVNTSPPQWFDVVLGSIYFTHFLTGLTVALVLWLRNRAEWAKWMRRYLGLNVIGLVTYILYPMAPPWMASEQGYIATDLPRLTSRGSRDLGLGGFHVVLADVGNPVAAMPSLHAGVAALVALYAIQRLRSRARWLLLLYPLAMSFGLVYFAEHYVIDAIAGFAAAGLVMWVCDWWERSPRTLQTWPASSPQVTPGAPATPLGAPLQGEAGVTIPDSRPATTPRFDEDSPTAVDPSC